MNHPANVPPRAYADVAAGTAVNLCLGILDAWSVWKAGLIADADHPAGSSLPRLKCRQGGLTIFSFVQE